MNRFLIAWLAVLVAGPSAAAAFLPPTANHFLFEPGLAGQFYVGTAGKPWPSGMFGCVRSEANQFHEGIDIQGLQRDKKGEPTDPVWATADGTVAYINRKPGLSNYGNYVILRHVVDGIEIHSLYAHLGHIDAGLREGHQVLAGQTLGVLGRTTNTKSPITRDRAHLHFELALLINHQFPAWLKEHSPGSRNDHGKWNGLNLLGVDPARILLAQDQQGQNFRLRLAIHHETGLCRVFVRQTSFPWLARFPQLIASNPRATAEGVAGYELALKFNGLPFQAIPRSAAEVPGGGAFQLLSVNASEYREKPCQRLVTRRHDRWELTQRARELLSLLTY